MQSGIFKEPVLPLPRILPSSLSKWIPYALIRFTLLLSKILLPHTTRILKLRPMNKISVNELANAMTATKGVDSSIHQVNIYGFTKGSYGAGNYTGDLQLTASAQPSWFADTVLCHGHRYVPKARTNSTFSASTGTDPNRYYLSPVPHVL